jgi:hypothetical protein
VNRQPIKRLCIASIILRTIEIRRKTKDEVALLICFLFDRFVFGYTKFKGEYSIVLVVIIICTKRKKGVIIMLYRE